MPSSTFLNLDKKKQDLFLKVAFQEFSAHDYNSASISEMVRTLNIAKGSVYQYFENKEDLFFYLVDRSFHEKMNFISDGTVANKTFASWFRNRQLVLLDFEKKKTMYSKLLANFYLQKNNPDLRKKYLDLKKKEMNFVQENLDKLSSSLRKKDDLPLLAYLILEWENALGDYPEIAEGKKLSNKAKSAYDSEQIIDNFAEMLSKGIAKGK